VKNWFRKQRYLIDYTLAALLRRKGKNLSLLAVYTLVVFLLVSVMLFSHSVKQEASHLLQAAPELVVQRMVAGRHDLVPASYLERLGQIRGVQQIEGRLWGYFFDPVTSANYTFMVAGDEKPAAGRIVIGEGIARSRGAGPGDVLSFRGYDGQLFSFTISRTLSHESALVSADLVLVNEQDFRSFFGVAAGQFTDIALSVRNPREVRKVAEKVVLALPDSRPIMRDEILRTYQSIFNWREGMILVLLVGGVLAFVIFAWEKASGLSAEERREIGILKAVGWETSDIIRMKFWEGLLISLTAFLLGYLLAYAHIFLFSSALFAQVIKGWAVLYPSFTLVPYVDGLQIATLLFLTVFPYAAATVVPIWRTAISDPDRVMR
jgi:ABC-type lipoprotein release transport system permease subunit